AGRAMGDRAWRGKAALRQIRKAHGEDAAPVEDALHRLTSGESQRPDRIAVGLRRGGAPNLWLLLRKYAVRHDGRLHEARQEQIRSPRCDGSRSTKTERDRERRGDAQ